MLDAEINNGLVARYKRVVYRKYPPVIGKCILLEKVYIIFIRYPPVRILKRRTFVLIFG